jgi:hypothetical protein
VLPPQLPEAVSLALAGHHPSSWWAGVIVCEAGRLVSIRRRIWPRLVSGLEATWWAARRGRGSRRDECRLFWSAPCSAPGYLTLNYVWSGAGTSLTTFRTAVAALDQIAWLRRAEAIVCEVFNRRISDRLLHRWGWERHLPGSSRRHFIKRFYGDWSRLMAW